MLGGPPTPGCGWAAGVERMLLAAGELPSAPPPVDLFVAHEGAGPRAAAFGLTAEARSARLNAQMELAGRSRKGQLKQADRLGARYVAILDVDGGAVLKDMTSGEQSDVGVGEVVTRILRERGRR
jgi:histidyl-tRNA synthetase